MTASRLEEEIRAVLDTWNRALLEKDVAVAADLRLDGYTLTADGLVLTRADELAMIGSPELKYDAIRLTALDVHGDDREATAACACELRGTYGGDPLPTGNDLRITFVKQDGRWRARAARMTSTAMPPPAVPPAVGRSTASRLMRIVAHRVKRWPGRTAASNQIDPQAPLATPVPSFPELTYRPYTPGRDFVLPAPRAADPSEEPPIPPPHLRTLHDQLPFGALHVGQMREIVTASGFSFDGHGRILDFGCGAGRMIRHFRDLAGTREIWGTDISAEHIYWCQRHLSPPFHFATTTKVPHLPFEDRSFQFIYCGSVFTHIDDLADAWLLELKRILAPGGRLYLTIHDEHTIALFESGRYNAEIVRYMKSATIYQEAKDAFGMFTIGRDNASQVFYHLDYFSKSLRSMFDILSVTREAYFYQTAILVTRP